jgi:membrane-bound inhibitor of C-type lysozyme
MTAYSRNTRSMKNGSLIGGLVIVLVLALGIYLLSAVPVKAPSPEASGPSPVTFYCGAGNTMQAVFSPAASSTPSAVALTFSDGTHLTLPQTLSGSGIRYESTSTGADLLFSGKGDYGSFTNSASTTDTRYASCTAADISAETGGRLLYENLGKSFTFTFPADFSVAGIEPGYGTGWTAPATTTGMLLAKIYVPQSYEPGTNFGDAWFTVGASSDPSAVATCLDTLSGPASSSTPVPIGGVTFTKLLFGGAGAGNRYDTTSYRAVKDGMCYAVEYTIHYGVLENYPKGAVQAFDEQKVADALDQIAQSFRFVQ